MFDGIKYKEELEATTNSESDKFAYFFDQLPAHKQAALMKKLGSFAENPDDLDAFVQGTYAQEGAKANDGSPAKALGAGSSSSEPEQLDEQKALELLWNSDKLDSNVQKALKRLFAPVGDPDRIEVDDKGDDKRLAKSNSEVTKLTKERDDAKQELMDERDESHKDSLAQKLKAAGTGSTTSTADMVKKPDLKTAYAALKRASATGRGRGDKVTLVDMPLGAFKTVVSNLDTLSN